MLSLGTDPSHSFMFPLIPLFLPCPVRLETIPFVRWDRSREDLVPRRDTLWTLPVPRAHVDIERGET